MSFSTQSSSASSSSTSLNGVLDQATGVSSQATGVSSQSSGVSSPSLGVSSQSIGISTHSTGVTSQTGADSSQSTSAVMDSGYIQEKLSDAQLKFEKACQHIVLLDQKIKDLEVRYKRAVKHKKNAFRYNLRLRLSVVTGVKMMYHHYASTKAEELHRLHRQRHTVAREQSASASDTSSDTREEA